MSRVVINSISITPQFANNINHLRGISGQDGGAGSKPQPVSSAGNAVTVDDATVTYTMLCTIAGNDCTLLIDTGSSNTWTGADKKFEPADSTCQSTRKSVKVSYGSGSFSGTEYTGAIVLGGKGSSLTIKNQSFAVATEAQGFNGVDGILGIGPVDLTATTVDGESSIPTITDNAYKQGLISTEMIGISYCPTQDNGDMANGSIMFGEVDESKIISKVTFVPITTANPARKYWGIDQEITYGSSKQMILKQTAGIVDTGTTLIMLAADGFQNYQNLTGATMDQTTGLLKLTAEQFKNLQSMYFNVGGVCKVFCSGTNPLSYSVPLQTMFELTPNAQIWPRSLNAALGGDADSIYTVFASMGEMSGVGLDFINGFTFLQRFYSCYDVSGGRVGLAMTPWTKAETN
ncbi:hypothetical protein GYMLUDRAFT_79850 [Collybiopsis luxurians FD-317 M1]|nr:hypothetical protein GYMLUDRAFT_79850 [Collybiopsis luxurians FD-317 M1]